MKQAFLCVVSRSVRDEVDGVGPPYPLCVCLLACLLHFSSFVFFFFACACLCVSCSCFQVGCTLDVYVIPSAFDALPPKPGPLKCFGAEIDVVSFRYFEKKMGKKMHKHPTPPKFIQVQ